MFPDRRVRAPKTAIVITARTTPYSAMVCPSSRDCSAAKSFCTCFTPLLVLGRRSGAADDESRSEKEDNVPAFLEPLSCLATGMTLKPNSIRSCLGVAAPPMAQLAGSSFLRRAAVNPRGRDCRGAFPCLGGARAHVGGQSRKRSGLRRAAVSLTSATLFSAGAAFSAGAGDLLVQVVEEQHAAATASPSAAAEEPSGDAECADLRRSDWAAEDCSEADGAAAGDSASADASAGEPEASAGEPDASAAAGAAPDAEASQPEAASPETASASTTAAIAAAAGKVAPASSSAGQSRSSRAPSLGAAVREQAKRIRHRDPGPPVIAPRPAHVKPLAKPDPEAREPGMAATIWLHRALPDPTPASRRLTRPFARNLRFASARHRVHWSIVLGVLRARGERGAVPASRRGLNRLAANLSKLGARQDEWTAALALEGRTAFADRAVALARYHRAVDISALEGKSIAGNQEPGGLTERAVRNLLLLPAELRPLQVISLLGLGGPSFPLANHDDHIHAGFLDREWRVVGISDDIAPWRTARRRGAKAVLELPAGESARRGLRLGDLLVA